MAIAPIREILRGSSESRLSKLGLTRGRKIARRHGAVSALWWALAQAAKILARPLGSKIGNPPSARAAGGLYGLSAMKTQVR